MATTEPRDEWIDNPLERLELIAGDDLAIAEFLDSLDVRGPRERELLAELARTRALADPDALPRAHRRVAAALESLGRHGYHEPQVPGRVRAVRGTLRFLVSLVARYVVVTYLRRVSTDLRNLYWLREIQAGSGSEEALLLERARVEAEGLREVFRRREIGLPSFVFGGVLLSVAATLWRAGQGVAFQNWWAAAITGVVGALIVLFVSWIVLRGAAMASRRIRLSSQGPLDDVWRAVGYCGHAPRDQSKRFAVLAISLTVAAWILLPLAVAIAVWR